MEDNGYIQDIRSSSIPEKLPKYSTSDVIYSIKQLSEYGFINIRKFDTLNFICTIFDITPHGHEFLKDIHDDTNWNKTKEIAKKVGSSSLNTLSRIASSVIANVITNMLQ